MKAKIKSNWKIIMIAMLAVLLAGSVVANIFLATGYNRGRERTGNQRQACMEQRNDQNAPQGQLPGNGQMPNGQFPGGPDGQMPNGQFPGSGQPGQMPEGGEAPNGEMKEKDQQNDQNKEKDDDQSDDEESDQTSAM